jgi:hypothetical protein
MGAAAILGSVAGNGAEAAVVCGGSERWNVKVAKDADAVGGKIDAKARPFSVQRINDLVRPGPFDPAGRMAPERREYRVRGYISYFTREADRDYHVVITDRPDAYAVGRMPAPGHSLVVEFPDPNCFGGKPASGSHSSAFGNAIAAARATFLDHVAGLRGGHITKAIPVTVTGVGFFDRYTEGSHEPKGHSKIYSEPDGRQVVLELHPVTEITFD